MSIGTVLLIMSAASNIDILLRHLEKKSQCVNQLFHTYENTTIHDTGGHCSTTRQKVTW